MRNAAGFLVQPAASWVVYVVIAYPIKSTSGREPNERSRIRCTHGNAYDVAVACVPLIAAIIDFIRFTSDKLCLTIPQCGWIKQISLSKDLEK